MVDDTTQIPSIELSRCLNQRHGGAACRMCVDICPTNAISMLNWVPDFADDPCVGCGACVSTCPTDAFAPGPFAPERRLVSGRRTRPPGSVAVACHLWPGELTASRPEAVLTHPRCLASLDLADLLSLTLDGTADLWLDDQACVSCPIGSLASRIADMALAASALLDGLGLPARVGVISSTEPVPVTVPVYNGAETVVDRRTLFRRAAGLEREGGPIRQYPRYDAGSNRLPPRIPGSRRRLDGWLESHGAAEPRRRLETGRLPWADIRVDPEACSACGLCAMFCPTGALVFAEDLTDFALAFRPSICLDCGICVAACPEEAVTAVDELPVSDLVTAPTRALVTGRLEACIECGASTAVRAGDNPLCSSCRHGSGTVKPLVDGAGLLDDLLDRYDP